MPLSVSAYNSKNNQYPDYDTYNRYKKRLNTISAIQNDCLKPGLRNTPPTTIFEIKPDGELINHNWTLGTNPPLN
jgi:hypothetical protein